MGKKEQFIKRAIQQSVDSVLKGGGPYGAVIVKNGMIIANAGNTVTMEKDPTAHAEINAIRMAAKKLDTYDLSGCEIFCSCEPCPMCLGAIYWARLDKIYFANTSDTAKEFGFDYSFIYKECETPADMRKVPTVHMQIDNALDAFKVWKEKEDKIKY